MNNSVAQTVEERLVHVPAGPVTLEGNLTVPEQSRGIVLFAHGSGSSRHSPRNRHVAGFLNEAKLATLLIDLLTPHEEVIDARSAQLRFSICSPKGSSTQRIGSPSFPIRSTFGSVTSAPAPVPLPRWWRRLHAPTWWVRSSREAAAQTWLVLL